jgi:hypothetical protein
MEMAERKFAFCMKTTVPSLTFRATRRCDVAPSVSAGTGSGSRSPKRQRGDKIRITQPQASARDVIRVVTPKRDVWGYFNSRISFSFIFTAWSSF